jgi:hypothetical protein
MPTPGRAEALALEALELRERERYRLEVLELAEQYRQRAGQLLEALEAQGATLEARAELLELRRAP